MLRVLCPTVTPKDNVNERLHHTAQPALHMCRVRSDLASSIQGGALSRVPVMCEKECFNRHRTIFTVFPEYDNRWRHWMKSEDARRMPLSAVTTPPSVPPHLPPTLVDT